MTVVGLYELGTKHLTTKLYLLFILFITEHLNSHAVMSVVHLHMPPSQGIIYLVPVVG